MNSVKFLTVEELAEMFKVHKNTVYNWVEKGLPHIKIDRIMRFDLDDVLKWAKENEGN